MSNRRLAVLLAMAMLVLVVDTSIINVSITAVGAAPRHDGRQHPAGDRPWKEDDPQPEFRRSRLAEGLLGV